MSKFISTSEAYRVARERADVAASFEADLLHTAIYDAREVGMSVREASTALGVPKSTVARHWRENHRCSDVLPMWGSDEAWREAHAAVWAHDPDELADDRVPYEWSDTDGQRSVRARTHAVARPRTSPIQDPEASTAIDAVMILRALARVLDVSPYAISDEDRELHVMYVRKAAEAVIREAALDPGQVEAARFYGGSEWNGALLNILFDGELVTPLYDGMNKKQS